MGWVDEDGEEVDEGMGEGCVRWARGCIKSGDGEE